MAGPTNNINVKLDSSGGSNKLNVVDEGGQNQVGKNAAATTITWHLEGPLAQGSFVSMSAAEPGFQWLEKGKPKDGVFGGASIGSNGNSLSITDNHLNDSTDGQWIYILRVNYQGQVICTQASLPRETVTDPVIINK